MPKINSGIKMYMQSAIAAAKTITAMTNAAPGVFTSTAHGYANGDIVLLEVPGVNEINNGLFKIVNTAANTFNIADVDGATGIDTTAFGVFASGTAKKVTLGTSVTGCSDFSPSGGEIKTLSATTVHDLVDVDIVAGATALSYGLTMQWDPANAAQQAMIAAFRTRASRGFKILWPDGAYALFYGTVGYTGAPGGGSQAITTSPAKVVMAGPVTNYAA
jgi:hypothetical protein